MEILTIVLIVFVIILIVRQKDSLSEKIDSLESQIFKLQNQITSLTKKTEESRFYRPEEVAPVIKAEPKPFKPEEVAAPPAEKKDATPKPVVVEPETLRPVKSVTFSPDLERKKPEVQQEPELSFFERYPDIEKFIGENLINKVGIAILVLSIGYFVKYAIDSNWIGPVGRVAIGIFAGAVLIGFAHKLRESYKGFSSVLVGGGLAVFYFTIALGFHQFHLFSQLVGLIIMIVITAFAVVLSLLYDKQELAVIALVGGLGSPFMLSTGHANYNGLFLYLLILNTGLLVIALFKAWRILNIVAFALTILIFGGVLFVLPSEVYSTAFIYASIFYLLFFAVNIAYNVRENKSFIASDFSILLVNTALYFSAGLWLLTEMKAVEYRGAFSAGLALVNLCLSYILFRNKKVDTNILYLLIGITLTFISLTAPIQLKGNHITLFWACETVLLFWLYSKSGIKLSKYVSQIIWIAMLISLIMDLLTIYSKTIIYPVILNKGFVTTIFASVGTFILSFLIKKSDSKEEGEIPWNVTLVTGITLLFLSGLLEVNYQFNTRFPDGYVNILYLMLYVPVFVLGLNFISSRVQSIQVNDQLKAGILILNILTYLMCERNFNLLQWQILQEHSVSSYHFISHWISAILIGVLFYQLITTCLRLLNTEAFSKVLWLLCAAVVLFLSLEVNLLSNMLFYSLSNPIDTIQRIYIKTGLPVLWGLSSFAIMWLGMKHKNRTLRIVSLSLFSLTLIKLFLFDIQDIPAAGKIVAFFCLGVLLLIVSFMYQKLKKIIITDAEPVQE